MEYYHYIKAAHIVFVISWMAGLLYIVRLFIYHTEAYTKAEPARSILAEEYKRTAAKLYNIISTPAMYLALFAGLLMFYLNESLHTARWFHIKLLLVACLIAYHFYCGYLMKKLRGDKPVLTSIQLRLFNELATLLMVAVVFIVILKSTINWVFGVVGLVIFAATLMLGVQLYKGYRRRKGEI